jgi:hypothetical protein
MPGGKSSKCDLYGQNSAGGINPLAESVFVQVGSDEEGIPKDAFWASKSGGSYLPHQYLGLSYAFGVKSVGDFSPATNDPG